MRFPGCCACSRLAILLALGAVPAVAGCGNDLPPDAPGNRPGPNPRRARDDGGTKPEVDAGTKPEVDAGVADGSAADAGPLLPDAGSPAPDAWTPPDAWGPEPDAGTGPPDAWAAHQDAWVPEPDAWMPEPDAWAPEPDAAWTQPDGGFFFPDAGMGWPDAWFPTPDGGRDGDAGPRPDSGLQTNVAIHGPSDLTFDLRAPVMADPISYTAAISYDNGGPGAETIRVTDAVLNLLVATYHFAVQPDHLAPVGSSTEMVHKVPGSAGNVSTLSILVCSLPLAPVTLRFSNGATIDDLPTIHCLQ